MVSKDDSFNLIKSLTKTEKRYFRLNTSVHGKTPPNYLRLFDAIDRQSIYDEQAIKKQFKGEAFIKQLSTAKNSLINKLLDSLRLYYAGSNLRSVSQKLRENLDHIEILSGKRTYTPMLKLLRRSKKLAYQYEEFLYLQLFIKLEYEWLVTQKAKNIDVLFDDLETEGHRVMQLIDLEHTFRVLSRKVFSSIRLNPIEGAEKDLWTEVLSHPILANISQLETFFCYRSFHNIKGSFALKQRDHQSTYHHFRLIIKRWEALPHMIADNPSEYLGSLANYMTGCYVVGKTEEHRQALDRVRQMEYRMDQLSSMHLKTICSHEVLYYLVSRKVTEGVLEAPRIIQLLESVREDMYKAQLLVIYYNLAVLYFFDEQPDKATEMLRNILHQEKTAARPDILRFSKLLLLVLYYEQNLPVLIATQHRSAYRSIKEPNVLEQLLLSQLKKLDHLKVLSRSEQRDFFRKLQTDLDVIQQQTPKLLGLDEIRIWVESRLTGQTMEAIFSSM